MQRSSRIKEFYKKSHKERLYIIKKFANLTEEEIFSLKNFNSLKFKAANKMVENVFSTMQIPIGIATNFIINNKEYLVPMATEEPSVIAAASNAAKLSRSSGGFFSTTTPPIMTGQIQVKKIEKIEKACTKIKKNEKKLISLANESDEILCRLGGGAKNLELRKIKTNRGTMLIVHLNVEVLDAMGANIVNTMVEKISPEIEKITGGQIGLQIVSNLPIHRKVKVKAVWPKEIIGEEVIEKILDAYEFACVDIFRSSTHNKGVMNGIDAVAIATGNDFRAIEAGAHSFVALEKGYGPLTKYYKNKDGNLVGEIELPLAVGIVGGITQTHPTAKICLKILGVKTSNELAGILASVGLAQNFSALKAMVTKGIQHGHMKLHSKNIALMAGAKGKMTNIIAQKMNNENNISVARAKKLIKEYEK